MKKLWAILLVLVLCVGMMITASAADTYKVKVYGGTGSGEYTENQTVTVKANEPPAGMYFVRWETQQKLYNVNLYDSEISFKSDDYYYITLTAIFAYPHEHTPCGETSCVDETHPTHTSHNYLPLEDVNDLRIDEGDNYYYLTSDLSLVDTPTSNGYISIGSGETLYLCLNGHDIVSSTGHQVFQLSGTGKLILCDCNGDDVSTWGKITHETSSNGSGSIGIRMSGSQNTTNDPVFEMYGGNITGNNPEDKYSSSFDNGAGVYADYGAAFTMYDGAITNNKTKAYGGGVCTFAGAKFTMYGGIISGNFADDGAGVYNNSVNTGNTAVIIHGGTISNNTSSNSGGGIYMFRNNYSSSVVDLIIDGGSIANNKAAYHGGGVYLDHAQATMFDGSVTKNVLTYNDYTPYTSGGGVYLSSHSRFNMNGGTITENTAHFASGVYVEDGGMYGMSASGNATVTNNKKGNVYLNSDDNKQVCINVTAPLTGQINVYTKDTPDKNSPVRYLRSTDSHTVTQSDLDHTESDRTGAYFIKNIDRENYGIFGNVQYTITITTDGNGTASANYTLAENGTPITLTATPAEGYAFKEWQVVSGGVTITDNKFTMGSADVEIKAIFEALHTCGDGTGVDGQAATCTTDGWEDYYRCSCGKLYADADCTDEITSLDAWKQGEGRIPAAHQYGELIAAQAEVHTQTELKPRVDAHYFCDECDTYFTADKAATTLAALTGTVPAHDAKGEWVNTDPEQHWRTCSVCKLADVVKADHVYTDDQDADCNDCGYVRTIAPKTYSVTVVNGTGDGNYEEGATVTITADAPAQGMQFSGWTSVDGVSFADASAATTTFVMPAKAVTVTANYEEIPPVTYTVTVTTDGNGTASADPASGVSGTEVTLTATPAEGYAFKEWQVISGNVTITDNKFQIGAENVAVKAIFEVIPVQPDPEPETYTVTFDPNGGTGSMEPQTFTEGVAQLLTKNTFTREGYTFTGWNMAQDGTGMPVTDGASLMVTGDVTLYAQWKANEAPKPNPDPQPEANPLLIIRHPADQVVAPGETADFTVVASGDGLSYQWYINRNDGRGWVKLQGANSPVYTTSAADKAFDGFQYACEVRDVYGNTARSNIAVLYIAAQPDVPQTGDSTNISLLCAMLFISCAGWYLVIRRKHAVR